MKKSKSIHINKIKRQFFLVLIIFLLAACQGESENVIQKPAEFDGTRAFAHAQFQVDSGPRTYGSPGHAATANYISDTLKSFGWAVSLQETTFQGEPVKNIIAKYGSGDKWIILGAHYDTRLEADRDPDPAKRVLPVPGANDGASGVAVLLELARVLPDQMKNRGSDQEIWLVFFDAEDNGNIGNRDWILGSQAFVQSIDGERKPDAAIIVDMIGDSDQQIYFEQSSDPSINQEIWGVAAELGYQNRFIPQTGRSILDDHYPFLQAGIPAVDIIDFDYPYWHTTADTIDKISPASLEAVGDTLIKWLLR